MIIQKIDGNVEKGLYLLNTNQNSMILFSLGSGCIQNNPYLNDAALYLYLFQISLLLLAVFVLQKVYITSK